MANKIRTSLMGLAVAAGLGTTPQPELMAQNTAPQQNSGSPIAGRPADQSQSKLSAMDRVEVLKQFQIVSLEGMNKYVMTGKGAATQQELAASVPIVGNAMNKALHIVSGKYGLDESKMNPAQLGKIGNEADRTVAMAAYNASTGIKEQSNLHKGKGDYNREGLMGAVMKPYADVVGGVAATPVAVPPGQIVVSNSPKSDASWTAAQVTIETARYDKIQQSGKSVESNSKTSERSK